MAPLEKPGPVELVGEDIVLRPFAVSDASHLNLLILVLMAAQPCACS